MFDINPNPDLGAGRQTTISGADHVDDELEGLMDLAGWCHLSPDSARQAVSEVTEAMVDWRDIATSNGAQAAQVAAFAETLDHRLRALTELAGIHTAAVTSLTASVATQPREARGTPRGGQFGPKAHAEVDIDLSK